VEPALVRETYKHRMQRSADEQTSRPADECVTSLRRKVEPSSSIEEVDTTQYILRLKANSDLTGDS
jgi:hypothetical protein